MAASRVNHPFKAIVAAALAAAALAGCGRHHAAPVEEASAPAVRPDALAGAPTDAPAPPPTLAYAPPPQPIERPGDQEVIYDLGPVVRAHDTMAPIPNPTEGRSMVRPTAVPRDVVRSPRRTVHAGRPHHRRATAATRSAIAPPQSAAARPSAAPHAAAARPTTTVKAPSAAAAKPAPTAAKPVPAPAKTEHAVKPSGAPREAVPLASGKPAHASAKTHPSKTAPSASADRSQQLSALQSALRGSVARTAVLNVPELKAGQPSEVTLTLPADFASVLRDQAGKQKLADAAASVNMTALLAGDGYAVAPDETQSQPLTIGQPTEFHWTVTAQPGARGPLHADVGADLLGGGDSALQLGSVSPSRGGGLHVSPRALGAGLLVLLAIIVFAWLSRSRRGSGGRATTASTRAYERPLDMRSAPPPPVDRER